MAVKSIQVKLMLAKHENVRQGLLALHKVTNAGVKYYTDWLALLRQQNLYTRDVEGKQVCYRTTEACKALLLDRLRERQKINGHTGYAGSDDELLELARNLYELLVPTCKGLKGDAQQIARKFLSPLTDPNSEGGRGTAKSGRKPRWMHMKEAGDPNWEAEKLKAESRKEADPTKEVLNELDTFGLLPLFDVFTKTTEAEIQWQPMTKRQAVRTWDRDMFQQAIERMLSWETWNQRVGEEYAQLVAQRDRFYEENFADKSDELSLVEQLENEMKTDSPGFASTDTHAFRLTPRSLRSAERVFEKWAHLPIDADFEAYDEQIKKVQAASRNQFGSYELFARLARPKFHKLWRDDPTFLPRYAMFNQIRRKMDGAKQFATFTLPDSRKHPVWTRFDVVGGNLHQYELIFNHYGKKRHAVRFNRLLVVEDGQVKEVDNIVVPVAYSKDPTNVGHE